MFIILVKPQMGENIGAVARIMKNFGIENLRIVEPRDGWPNEKAIASSVGAANVIHNAKVFYSLNEAIGDLQFLYATTAQHRSITKGCVLSRDISSEVLSMINNGVNKIGIMFGRENWGLSNDDISLANKIVTIDTNPEFSSLNISHAVGTICYELFNNKANLSSESHIQEDTLATRQQMQYFYDHLFKALNAVNFFRIPEKKEHMSQKIINIFSRIDKLSSNEVQTLHGIVAALKTKSGEKNDNNSL